MKKLTEQQVASIINNIWARKEQLLNTPITFDEVQANGGFSEWTECLLEDIAELYDDIPIGTKVTVVNQPQVYGLHNGVQYLQTYPVQDDYVEKKIAKGKNSATNKKTSDAKKVEAKPAAQPLPSANANPLVAELLKSPRGIAMPISLPQINLDKMIAEAPQVENQLPDHATWDGVE